MSDIAEQKVDNVIAPDIKFEKILKVYNAVDFIGLELPPRNMIVDPIIPTQGIAMLYAGRGIGKTFVGLSIACGVATGTKALARDVPVPRKVVYIDGEMSPQTMQDRMSDIFKGINRSLPSEDALKIVNISLQDNCSLDLSLEECQSMLDPHLEGVDLVIVDNLSTLTSIKENDADDWLDIQKWLIKLRQRNVSVLLIHHASKSGNQRGTSRKEDILDTVITLKHSSNYDQQQGACFEVKYEKCRGFSGDKDKPFEALLQGDSENGLTWEITSDERSKSDKIKELLGLKMSPKEISAKTGIPLSTVYRIKRNLEAI